MSVVNAGLEPISLRRRNHLETLERVCLRRFAKKHWTHLQNESRMLRTCAAKRADTLSSWFQYFCELQKQMNIGIRKHKNTRQSKKTGNNKPSKLTTNYNNMWKVIQIHDSPANPIDVIDRSLVAPCSALLGILDQPGLDWSMIVNQADLLTKDSESSRPQGFWAS